MVWKIEYTPQAEKILSGLDRSVAVRIVGYLDKRVVSTGDPRRLGKALLGPLGEFWRYRVGDYRILAKIEDEKLLILVVRIGHHSKIYGTR